MSDLPVRMAAFEWLKAQVAGYGDVLPRPILAEGFIFQGERVPLLGPQGIFKPKICDLPLSITSIPGGPYADRSYGNDFFHYRYRGTDPGHRDNAGLRAAMRRRIPLVFFVRLMKGRYFASWPVFIEHDDPANLTFTVSVEDERLAVFQGAEQFTGRMVAEDTGESRRAYLTAQTKVRLHQRSFRERVLRAYREQCAFCRLKHQELLDAAHIVADSDPEGEPVVTNGLALCKLHHAAFDSLFLGVTTDYVIRVRPDILREPDGPMHLHGLKAMEGQRVILPRNRADWPDPALLEKRYLSFRSAH